MLPLKLIMALIVMTLLGACGTKYSNQSSSTRSATPTTSSSSVLQRTEPTVTPPTTVSPAIQPSSVPQPDAPRSLPAAIALRSQATLATDSEQYGRAIALLERALRISPNDPATFLALAENHLSAHRPQQALELTRRALTMSPTAEQKLTLEALQQRCLALL